MSYPQASPAFAPHGSSVSPSGYGQGQPTAPSPRPIGITIFASEATSRRELKQVWTFVELLHVIGVPHPVPSKEGTRCYSPAEWRPEHPSKSLEGVLRGHFGVLDLDGITPEQLAEVESALRCPYVIISSFSHGDEEKRAKKKRSGSICVRLVVPFSRPVEMQEWERFKQTFLMLGCGYHDEKCEDLSHIYYEPSHPPNPPAPPIYRYGHLQAPPIDVDAVLAAAPEPSSKGFISGPIYGSAPANATEAIAIALRSGGMNYEGAPITSFELRTVARKWSKASKHRKFIAAAIEKMLDGKPFAEDGERDNTLFQVSASLAKAFPHASAQSMAALMAPSLEAMGMDGPTVADAYEKIRRKQAEPRLESTGRIADLFLGERAAPYTPEEVASFAAQQECTVEQFHRRWIIQRGRSFFLYVGKRDMDGVCRDGTYEGPYQTDDVLNGARRDLSAATSAGVVLDSVTKETVRSKTITELVKDYGTVALKAIIDLTADYSHYEPKTRTFVEATCPLRELEPRYDEPIDMWILTMTGENYNRLCEWLAACTLLDSPCAGLFLSGPRGAGKSLLACGAAQLWGGGPTDLEQALADFNEAVSQCPLLFADEHVPVDLRGRPRTAGFREVIQARSRTLKRKFLPPTKMKGCVRVIFAANNKNLLYTNENLTQHDIEAFAERIFHVPVKEAARDYLKQLEREQPGIFRTWIEGDLIARHMLWLRDNIAIDRRNRFLVSGGSNELVQEMTINDRWQSAICAWLVSYLLDPSKVAATPLRACLRVENGKLLVNAQVLVENWDFYKTNEPAMPAGRIARALSSICEERRVHRPNAKGQQVFYRQVNERMLITWARQNDAATEQTILEILKKGIA